MNTRCLKRQKKSQMLTLRKNPQGLVFNIYVQPRSSKNKIVGLHADSLKIKVAAPPVDGAANKMCLKFLAKHLAVPPSALEIISGHNSRTKMILLKPAHTPPSAAEYARLEQQIKRLIK